jgi:hypothetical protein
VGCRSSQSIEDEDLATKLQLPARAVCISPEKRQIVGLGVETVETSSGFTAHLNHGARRSR